MIIQGMCVMLKSSSRRLSQIPDFDGIWWLSYIAAAMSFGYVSSHYSEETLFASI